MIVVAVLMISCHVSTLPHRGSDGAQVSTRKTQRAKNQALATRSATPSANRSNND